jgi:hypothetical protein
MNKNKLLELLFDEYFGFMRGGYVLNETEYDECKKWSIQSGCFEYQINSDSLQTDSSMSYYLMEDKCQ